MKTNVSDSERLASLALGALSIAVASLARRRTRFGAGAAGAAALGLFWRGASGNCPVYQNLGIDTEADAEHVAQPAVRAVLVNKPVEEVVSTLRELIGRERLRELEISPAPNGRGTRMTRSVPAPERPGAARALAAVRAAPPLAAAVEKELRDLKALVETGEIATVAGQAHGRRSRLVTVLGGAVDKIRETAAQATRGTTPTEGAGRPARRARS